MPLFGFFGRMLTRNPHVCEVPPWEQAFLARRHLLDAAKPDCHGSAMEKLEQLMSSGA